MSEVTNLAVVAREKAGKGEARATRRQGLVPGVIYGNKQDPVTIAVDPRKLWAELNKAGFYTRLFNVQVEGKNELCLCRDVARHPVTEQPIHFDMQRVSATAKVHVWVPVHFINQETSPGIKRGGVLNIVHHELQLSVAADHIPHALVVDLAALDVGAIVHMDLVPLPEGASVITHETALTIATIAAPTVAPASETAAAPAAAPAAPATTA